MSDNTTDFGAIEAQTTDTTDETTFAEFGGEERSNRAESEPRLETETATEFGVDDRPPSETADSGSQTELSGDAEAGQLDLTGDVATTDPDWADTPDGETPEEPADEPIATENPIERAEACTHPTTTARTCTDQYGNTHTKHICDRCSFTVTKHSGTDSDHCERCTDGDTTEGDR